MSLTDTETAPPSDSFGGFPRPEGPSGPPPRRPLSTAALVLAAGLLGAGTVHVLSPASAPATTTTTSFGAPTDGQVGAAPFDPEQFGFNGALPGSSGGDSSAAGSAPANAAAIADKIDPAIVDITTTLGLLNGEAAGTGIVLTPNGEILTNNHVISGATAISVTDVGDGRTYTADVVGYDKAADVAVLQLRNASGLATARIAGTPAKVGDGVVGVGNAGGAGGTPSYAGGVVTATGQTITASDEADGSSEQLRNLLQTNAGIVSGDSGGPMVNTDGEVVGLDTAASSGFRFSQPSEGFAIPIADALSIAKQIEAGSTGNGIHLGPTPMLGIAVAPDGSGFSTSGAVIEGVMSGGPAAAGGLSAGDTITALGSDAVGSAADLTDAMLTHRPGENVTVHYRDANGAARSTKVTLAQGPAQ